jgi:hypothetical protein
MSEHWMTLASLVLAMAVGFEAGSAAAQQVSAIDVARA